MNKLTTFATVLGLCAGFVLTTGCRSGGGEKKKDEFFTSGSREADQRATQRMAKDQQIAGTTKDDAKGGTGAAAVKEERKLTLFERLGGEQGVTAIVDDFTTRALEDPRVNWQRKGVKRGGILRRDETTVAWSSTPENLARLKQHLVQFIALATGGPAQYEGKDMKTAHAAMHITNPEFDAVVGDLKVSLDKLQIPTKEQKELLAIVESTRPQIVTER
jgi:hemoglobin